MTPYFNDDGTEFNPNLMPAPGLCVTCRKNNQASEEITCNLTRADQREEEKFICFAYESISGAKQTKAILLEMEKYLNTKQPRSISPKSTT